MRVEGCAPLQIQVGANSGEGNSREPSTPRTCGRTDRPAPIAACLWRIADFCRKSAIRLTQVTGSKARRSRRAHAAKGSRRERRARASAGEILERSRARMVPQKKNEDTRSAALRLECRVFGRDRGK
jgi:ribosomal protein L44E